MDTEKFPSPSVIPVINIGAIRLGTLEFKDVNVLNLSTFEQGENMFIIVILIY